MASNGANQPLLSGFVDSTPQTNNKDAPKRRRLRRCRSAPQTDVAALDINEKDSTHLSESLFGKPRPNFKRVLAYLAAYLGGGSLSFYAVNGQIEGLKTNEILDSIYFCIVTMTTVGYGDLVPNSVVSKLLSCAFVFTGMGLVGLFLSKAADYLVDKQEILLVKALHRYQKVGPTDILKEIETNKVRYKCIIMLVLELVLILVGTIFLVVVEKMSFVDAFYCVCSTITTLGYGDKSFSTTGGRAFSVVWISSSTMTLAQFFLYVAEFNTENRQKALVNWVLTRKMTHVDLEAADIDEDGVVSAAEFIIYKLKEMGKISQEDIALVMEEFQDLDFDQSGTLSPSDLFLAQDSQTKS